MNPINARQLLATLRAMSEATGDTAVWDGERLYTAAIPLHIYIDGQQIPLKPGITYPDGDFTVIWEGKWYYKAAVSLHTCNDGRLVPLRFGTTCADCEFTQPDPSSSV